MDLEVRRTDKSVRAWGAVLNGRTLAGKGLTRAAVRDLDELTGAAEFVAGHNLIAWDLGFLHAQAPDLRLLGLPAIDTLHLSALAFPAKPYHALTKHYRATGQSGSDPVEDAQLSRRVLVEAWEKIATADADLRAFLAWSYAAASSLDGRWAGMAELFRALGAEPLSASEAAEDFVRLGEGRACTSALGRMAESLRRGALESPWPAFVLAWLQVADGRSVLPGWVWRTLEEVGPRLSELCDQPCGPPACEWCAEHHGAESLLGRFFGHQGFRPEPSDEAGVGLQRQVVEAGLRGDRLLAILPTGAGKSLCYQLPALARHQRRGLLTIVVSPLQALMNDQVTGLVKKTGAKGYVDTLNGTRTPLERSDALRRIREGDTGLLYVSPEQLRSTAFRSAIKQREIGAWVIDEAHCLSEWGHDFRPDYRYVWRFIEKHTPGRPVACFTATAKADVRDEILKHFGGLRLFSSTSVERANLSFAVQEAKPHGKAGQVDALLRAHLEEGAAVVFAATRKGAEALAHALTSQGWVAAAYHAGLARAERLQSLDDFMEGRTRVVCATNAFGMGIDKDDVRLVVHADIPGSLEAYLQEAGRAGRDGKPARCVLLYDPEDVEQQFRLSAYGRLTQHEVGAIWRSIRASAQQRGGKAVLTTAEILRNTDEELAAEAAEPLAQTKTLTAIANLEDAGLLVRNENQPGVFQCKILVPDVAAARALLARFIERDSEPLKRCEAILEALWTAGPDEGLSADALTADFGTDAVAAGEQVLDDLRLMERAAVVETVVNCTAHVKGRGTKGELERVAALERALIGVLEGADPDTDGWLDVAVRHVNSRLLATYPKSTPERLRQLLDGLAQGGRKRDGGGALFQVRYRRRDHWQARAPEGWAVLKAHADRRASAAAVALEVVRAQAERVDGATLLQAAFTLQDVERALGADLVLATHAEPLAREALLFLNTHGVIQLGRGLAVFRPALTIELTAAAKGQSYTKKHFEPLQQHYENRAFQTHVMDEYARLGLENQRRAQALVDDYFKLPKRAFTRAHFKGRQAEVKRPTSVDSYDAIVKEADGIALSAVQRPMVSAPADKGGLILAGPGSGKTRVVVHRCAYLLRVERVPARAILLVCFNRAAARGIRSRLVELVGADAYGVMVQTYHGLALRLTGRSAAALFEEGLGEKTFDAILDAAVTILHEKERAHDDDGEDDELRERILAGYSHILVDEYQDIDEKQYELLRAITGTGRDAERRVTILAVGDDDQNIYAWRGAKNEFIGRFRSDYGTSQDFLLENFRSSGHIVGAANKLIARNVGRLKERHPIDSKGPAGEQVTVLRVRDAGHQAGAVALEIRALEREGVRLSDIAVLGRSHAVLAQARAAIEHVGVSVSRPLRPAQAPRLHQVREVHALLAALQARRGERIDVAGLREVLRQAVVVARPDNPWHAMSLSLVKEVEEELGEDAVPVQVVLDTLYEALLERGQSPTLGDGVVLSTVHGAKGLEYRHVFVLDGDWNGYRNEKPEARRRLFYVGMTRAKASLRLFLRQDDPGPASELGEDEHVRVRAARHEVELPDEVLRLRYELIGLGDLYVGYAGWRPAGHRAHRALGALEPGSTVNLVDGRKRISVRSRGQPVAELSTEASERWRGRLDAIIDAKVVAMVRRTAREEGDEWGRPKVEQWELPLVEVRWR